MLTVRMGFAIFRRMEESGFFMPAAIADGRLFADGSAIVVSATMHELAVKICIEKGVRK